MKTHSTITVFNSAWVILPIVAGVCLSASIQHPLSNQTSNAELEATTNSSELNASSALMDKNSTTTYSILTKLGIHLSGSSRPTTENDDQLIFAMDTTGDHPRRIRRSSVCKRHSDYSLAKVLRHFNRRKGDGSLLSFNYDTEETTSNDVLHNDKRRQAESANRVINADGSETEQHLCKERNREEDGHYQLCSVCDSTTRLPSDRFPRTFNEQVCRNTTENDGLCFPGTVDGTWYGRCAQREMNITMLRRTNHCTATDVQAGQRVYFEEWEPYTQSVRVGCECELNVLSFNW